MYVPNYIPEPIEIPGNVTEEPYLVRLAYIKRVAALHVASLMLVVWIAHSPITLPAKISWWPLAVMIIGLAAVRITLRRTPLEAHVSTWLLIPLLLSVGQALNPIQAAGWPIWTILTGPVCALIYAIVCGRDFSFLGQYVLALIASSTFIALASSVWPYSVPTPSQALIANAAYLSYWVYDLASLLARRRLGEELAAVVDLYRDVLNLFGYVARCIGHWRKHRIWVLPR